MGELARQPGCPELSASPLELLKYRPDENAPTLQKWVFRLGGVVLGVIGVMSYNAFRGRPFWAGFQYHLLIAGFSSFAVDRALDIRFTVNAEADEVFRHYITLHPEDFPPYERIRFRDVYKPFQPVR